MSVSLPGGPFGTIIADPPWRYREERVSHFREPGGGPRHKPPGVSEHYETMTPADVAALPVRDIVADDAHLYLWITNPKLFEARPMDILDAWGFRYITLLTWVKRGSLGLGHYFRGETEHVIFAVRGRAPIEPKLRVRNVFEHKKLGHSVKPDTIHEIAERCSPGPRIELFARRARPGWERWGVEA